MSIKRILRPGRGKSIVFFDFDNTIARRDIIDDMVKRFSPDRSWVRLEDEWKAGRIGSRACLTGQVGALRITPHALKAYLGKVTLDPWFKKTARLLEEKRIPFVILSDNFTHVIKQVLAHQGLGHLKVYANVLTFKGDGLRLTFPHAHAHCPVCGHCKTKNLLAKSRPNSIIVYVGDGRSDICPAMHADLVFAKDTLQKHFKEKKLSHIPIKNLREVYYHFKKA